MSKEKIKIKPNGIVFFEGSSRRIPEEGAEVSPSIYYRRLINDGSIEQLKEAEKKRSTPRRNSNKPKSKGA